ncbi:hypothetical protein SAMN02910456_01968 [Ruminococcaceae bacterium YRB3002]|nr:hypothetical protein SAMN02910456_01968 [Ruminococcaceae bacterium YRB3002]
MTVLSLILVTALTVSCGQFPAGYDQLPDIGFEISDSTVLPDEGRIYKAEDHYALSAGNNYIAVACDPVEVVLSNDEALSLSVGDVITVDSDISITVESIKTDTEWVDPDNLPEGTRSMNVVSSRQAGIVFINDEYCLIHPVSRMYANRSASVDTGDPYNWILCLHEDGDIRQVYGYEERCWLPLDDDCEVRLLDGNYKETRSCHIEELPKILEDEYYNALFVVRSGRIIEIKVISYEV